MHHGSNPQYLDTNYGGIVIIWDRLFGSFVPEDAPVTYGLTTNIDTYNPVRVAWQEFYAIGRDVVRAGSWSDRWRYAFGSPGWAGSVAVDPAAPESVLPDAR